MRKPSVVPLIAVILCVATALALLGAVEAQNPSRELTGKLLARSTVRSYYASVEMYLRTGDLSGVSSVFETGDEAIEDEWRLRALRANYPQLSIDVVDMVVDGEMVSAEITLDAGPEGARLPIQPFQHLRSWRAWEVFRVQDNLVVEHSSAGPDLGLFVPQGTLSIDRHPAGGMKLLTARLTFPRGMDSYVALPAPAMVTVESGIIEVQVNGVASLMPVDAESPALLEPGTVAHAESNDALITGNARLVVSNVSESPSTLIVALLAPNQNRPPIEAEHAEQQTGGGFENLTSRGVLVDSLGNSPLPDKHIGQMSSGWVVLEPGGSATIDETGTIPHLIPVLGHPVVNWDPSPGQPAISNPDPDQIVVWAVLVS